MNYANNHSNRQRRVLLIYTGGTIGMGMNPRTGALEPLDFGHLIKNVSEFSYLNTEIETYQFSQPIDSSDMSPRLWAQLVRIIADKYEQYDGFVVLHGTDTMAYTASALSFMLENLTKPVILTGSQLPIGQPRTDGKENLVTSIEIASTYNDTGHAVVPEVCIYFSGRLLRGNRSTKQNADGFDAFDTFNYPHLCDAGVTFNYHLHNILKPDFSRTERNCHEKFWKRQRPAKAMDNQIAQRGFAPWRHDCEHQPMSVRHGGDGKVRHRIPAQTGWCR